jgi:cysteine desulfuration protein SufE
MTLADIQESFELLDGWEDRYRYLIDLGRRLPPMDAADKNERTKVEGCMSQVWMVGRPVLGDDGALRLALTADSDASIVRGLIAVLMAVYDHQPIERVLATDITSLFDDLGLGEHISMNRRNGFYAMVQRIRREAELARAGAPRA